jgi:hypothetical protein
VTYVIAKVLPVGVANPPAEPSGRSATSAAV